MSIAIRRSLVQLGAALLLLVLPVLPVLALAEEGAETAATALPVAQAGNSVPDPLTQSVPWYQHIQDAAKAHGVDAHLLQAVVKVESNFDPSVVSRSGAIGLMQIMPTTAAGFIGLTGTRQSLRQQLQDPAINVYAGALYLRSLLDTFSQRVDLALAAYNAGSGNVRKAGNRVPPNGQTPQFVKKVTDLYASIKAAALAAEAAAPAASETSPFNPAQPVFSPQ
jgi:soluble lytic murein transglycosylase-like protein